MPYAPFTGQTITFCVAAANNDDIVSGLAFLLSVAPAVFKALKTRLL